MKTITYRVSGKRHAIYSSYAEAIYAANGDEGKIQVAEVITKKANAKAEAKMIAQAEEKQEENTNEIKE